MTADLAACLGALAGARVLAIGDVMLDRYVYGEVERISPEAPIPVLKIARETPMLGGAGNVLRNLAALGARCDFFGAVGDDATGAMVRDLAAAEPGAACRLLVQAGRPTTIKERFIAAGQQLLRSDRESSQDLEAETARALISDARSVLEDKTAEGAAKGRGGPGVMILSDYGKGVLAPAVTADLIAAAPVRRP